MEQTKKRRKLIATAIAIAFVGYPLSIGPAAMAVQLIDSTRSEQTFQTVYAPILALPPPIDRNHRALDELVAKLRRLLVRLMVAAEV